jgi:molecular chaperone DnaK
MMREAEAHSDEDKKRREEIEIRNRADQSLYTAERMLKDAGEKIPISDKNAIESAMADLKKAIEGNDVPGMSRAMDALMTAQHKASEALYKAGAAAGGGGEAGAGGGGGAGASGDGGGSAPGGQSGQSGDVIDAEVVEDEKK